MTVTLRGGIAKPNSVLSMDPALKDKKKVCLHCVLDCNSKPTLASHRKRRVRLRRRRQRPCRLRTGRTSRWAARSTSTSTATSLWPCSFSLLDSSSLTCALFALRWVRIPQSAWASGNYQGLFMHGDASYRTCERNLDCQSCSFLCTEPTDMFTYSNYFVRAALCFS